jgi:hypothetical protein
MRVSSLLFGIGTLVTQLTLAAPARAATDIFRSPSNNTFAVASSNPETGPSQQVTVVRTIGASGGPITGLISVAWTATGSQGTSGTTSFGGAGTTIRFVGTRVDSVASISGTLFATTLVDPFQLSYISATRSTLIIMQRN